ncbi:uncharacterized protein LOC118309453 isoform X2 [Scophthalmus maximus]|uniref:uncharacterized protein LOC118309453 isoform X2 n=1 Tax=Scophthalmus maximus TaxID=52904 RepID=UPI0015E122E0|nr:uncharacterized protein LOC118309453 isoform X2 [Scophthalmus maximus]
MFSFIMAGRLLLGILICTFQEIHVEAIPPPKLTANTPEITETDTVTLNCLSPSNPSPSQCYFYTGGESTKIFSCMKRLTGTELLQMAQQSSPAEVKVTCFYTNMYGDIPSEHSPSFTITIKNRTVGRPHALTPLTPTKVLTVTARNAEEHLITSSLTTVKPTSVTANQDTSISVASATKPPVNLTSGDNVRASKTDMRIWKLVSITTGFGITVVVSLGLALLCTKGMDGAMSCRSFLHADNEKPNRREPQNENVRHESVIYHQYATISDEPYASAPKEMVYSTLQPV